MFSHIHGNGQCWMVVCASHIPAGPGKNHEPAPAVFPAWETENIQNNWVCDISDGVYCDQQNLKPSQAPSRCWDSMPQVDSGSCKMNGRDNENWWMTALSTCIRGLTGQSVPKSKWQKMLFLTAQWQGGQAVSPHQQMPSILPAWLAYHAQLDNSWWPSLPTSPN